jgi:hypothetical protein
MPEVLRIRGYRFFFFSREGHEPRHIHVEQAERYAKSGSTRSSSPKHENSAERNYASFTRLLKNIATSLSLLGMSTLASKPVADAVDVKCTDDELIVTLVDGRRVSAPLAWFPRLLRATPKQRANWRLIGRGTGIHWDDVDEDISVRTLLAS